MKVPGTYRATVKPEPHHVPAPLVWTLAYLAVPTLIAAVMLTVWRVHGYLGGPSGLYDVLLATVTAVGVFALVRAVTVRLLKGPE